MRARLATSVLALPALFAVAWAGNPWVGVLAALAALLALQEAYRLRRLAGHHSPSLVAVPAGTAIVLLALSDGVSVLVGFATTSVFVTIYAVSFRRLGQVVPTLGILACIALPLAALVLLRAQPLGLDWIIAGLLAVFATDSAAFFVGRSIGRRKMAPSISPGKTWEGALGGLLGGSGATVALLALLGIPWTTWPAIGMGLGIAALAQGGDLVESKLKRLAGAKDSGSVFPGHGGMLDRLDSLLPVFVLLYYGAVAWPQ